MTTRQNANFHPRRKATKKPAADDRNALTIIINFSPVALWMLSQSLLIFVGSSCEFDSSNHLVSFLSTASRYLYLKLNPIFSDTTEEKPKNTYVTTHRIQPRYKNICAMDSTSSIVRVLV